MSDGGLIYTVLLALAGIGAYTVWAWIPEPGQRVLAWFAKCFGLLIATGVFGLMAYLLWTEPGLSISERVLGSVAVGLPLTWTIQGWWAVLVNPIADHMHARRMHRQTKPSIDR